MNALALIVSGSSIGTLLLWFVGVLVCFAIVFFIMRQLEAPPIAYKILYVIAGLIALLVAIDFFFGVGPIVVR